MLVGFFLPWAQLFGQGLSGFEIGKLGSYGNWAWTVPLGAGATLLLGYYRANQRPVAFIAGLLPLIGLVYALIKVGEDIFHIISIGAYITLIAGFVLLVYATRSTD